jgi:hypothetical protein
MDGNPSPGVQVIDLHFKVFRRIVWYHLGTDIYANNLEVCQSSVCTLAQLVIGMAQQSL